MKSVLNSLTTEDKGNTSKLNWHVLTISLLILTFQKDNFSIQSHFIFQIINIYHSFKVEKYTNKIKNIVLYSNFKLIKFPYTFLHGNLRSAILDLWTMSFKMEANGVTPIPPPTNMATSYLYQS